MVISIVNFKGGMGKSMIAHQLITTYGYRGVEVDPYGSLADRLSDSVESVSIDKKNINFKNIKDNTIFDFGGFDSILIDKAVDISNLVVVPMKPTLESISATINTINRLIELNKPILFVFNEVQKKADVEASLTILAELMELKENEIDYIEINDSTALQSAINENCSVKKFYDEGGIKKFAYEKAFKNIENLHKKILNYK